MIYSFQSARTYVLEVVYFMHGCMFNLKASGTFLGRVGHANLTRAVTLLRNNCPVSNPERLPQLAKMSPSILNRLRRTRTTGIRSTGLICKGPKTLFMFVFGKLCLYLFCFVFCCLYLSFVVFICLYLSLFVFVCLLFVTASCCSTWDLASSSTSTIHRRGLSPPWCEFVF